MPGASKGYRRPFSVHLELLPRQIPIDGRSGEGGSNRCCSLQESALVRSCRLVRRSMTAVGRMARSCRSHLYARIPKKTGGLSRASVLSDKRDLALGFFWRPAIRLGAGAAHQHRPLGVVEAVRLQEGLDALLVVDDRKRARPVRAPQAALEPPGVE
jgi:hypothetical protein